MKSTRSKYNDQNSLRMTELPILRASTIHSPFSFLVRLELERFGLDAILGDDHNFDGITGVDIALPGGYEGILDNLHDLLGRELALVVVAVLVGDDIVHERDEEGLAGTGRREGSPLEASDGIVGVDGTLAVGVDASQYIEGVVGEESLVVKGIAEHLSDGRGGHGFAVVVLINLFTRGVSAVGSECLS